MRVELWLCTDRVWEGVGEEEAVRVLDWLGVPVCDPVGEGVLDWDRVMPVE